MGGASGSYLMVAKHSKTPGWDGMHGECCEMFNCCTTVCEGTGVPLHLLALHPSGPCLRGSIAEMLNAVVCGAALSPSWILILEAGNRGWRCASCEEWCVGGLMCLRNRAV